MNQVSTFPRVVLFLLAATVFSRPAEAQYVYTYQSNPFHLFSCGPDPDGGDVCSDPLNGFTSYRFGNRLTITLNLPAPLPANMPLTDFSLTAGMWIAMTDGVQTLINGIGNGDWTADALVVALATDSTGQIVEWDLGVGLSGTGRWMQSFGYRGNPPQCAEFAYLVTGQPGVPADFATYTGDCGSWTYPTAIGPEQALRNLINLLPDPALDLRRGQINSFFRQLNDALTSFLAGQIQQAINQLNSFINHVRGAVNAGQLSEQTGARLITEATAILGLLTEL